MAFRGVNKRGALFKNTYSKLCGSPIADREPKVHLKSFSIRKRKGNGFAKTRELTIIHEHSNARTIKQWGPDQKNDKRKRKD